MGRSMLVTIVEALSDNSRSLLRRVRSRLPLRKRGRVPFPELAPRHAVFRLGSGYLRWHDWPLTAALLAAAPFLELPRHP